MYSSSDNRLILLRVLIVGFNKGVREAGIVNRYYELVYQSSLWQADFLKDSNQFFGFVSSLCANTCSNNSFFVFEVRFSLDHDKSASEKAVAIIVCKINMVIIILNNFILIRIKDISMVLFSKHPLLKELKLLGSNCWIRIAV